MDSNARAVGVADLQHAGMNGRQASSSGGDRFEEIPPTPLVERQGSTGLASPELKKQPSQKSTRAGPPPTSAIPPVPTSGTPADESDVLNIGKEDSGVQTPGSNTDVRSSDSYVTAPAQLGNRQKIYDISTRLVGTSLELTLVYILRLDFGKRPSPLSQSESANGIEDEATHVRSLSLLSSYGLPTPEPAFDAVLHLKALRSEEGGLLYQNPNIDELVAGERLPTSEEVEYASALLVPVCESDSTGYVLAGFTDDPERVFERSDLEYMHTIASEVGRSRYLRSYGPSKLMPVPLCSSWPSICLIRVYSRTYSLKGCLRILSYLSI
jgi:hypothetical protein